MQFAMIMVWCISQTWSLYDVFYLKSCVRKLRKLFWINLLTVKSGLSSMQGFQMKVENNKLAELN